MRPTDFTFEWAFLVLAVAAGAAYLRAARRDPPPSWRAAAFGAGLFLVAAPLDSPLETLAAKYLLMMHLLQNALIADIAPLLLLLGLTPAMRARVPLGRLRARYALPLWLLAWYLTHLAAFYDWALRTGWGLNLEHAILIAAGLVFWWPLVTGRLATPAALGYLGVAFVGSAFLGLAYIFSSSAFYAYYEHAPRIWGLSPVRDQNLGGIVMNGEQTAVFLSAIGWFVLRLLAEEDERGRLTEATESPAEG
jgi:cytochrome c oxidase assembly factor CtaG